MNKKHRLSSNSGMTLVEVLVAFTLLVLIIFVFTPLFMNYYKNIRTAGQITQTTYERASLMERLVSNWGKNDSGYEEPHSSVPMVLRYGSSGVLDFTDSNTAMRDDKNVEGNLISENINNENSYVTLHTDTLSKQMVAFPKSITDDFIETKVTVVADGFTFESTSYFSLFNTTGTTTGTTSLTGYFSAEIINPHVAVITLKGGNEVICFEKSPLILTYYEDSSNPHSARIEIGAPEIILVGEKANDGNYYYYATAGVDTSNHHMDIIAKQMTGTDGQGNSVALNSAMNDVEWVAKGMGDDGNGGVNKYGYYVMGGDCGQVRRFWKQSDYMHNGSPNYTWGGDDLVHYDRYMNLVANGSASGDSEEDMDVDERTTQAYFKSIFLSPKDEVAFNSNAQGNRLMGSTKISITNLKYKAITSAYYTVNVLSTDKHKTTIGRVLNYNKTSGGTGDVIVGNSTEGWVSKGIYNKHLNVDIGATNTYASTLNMGGYKAATGYGNEYPNDDSLITITSVGAIRINTDNSKYYRQKDEDGTGTITGSYLYPEESYTLYCGTIPAVTNILGWASGDQDYYHAATLGIATNGETWYPTGKFADTKTTSTTLSGDVFQKGLSGTASDRFSWASLLNFSDSKSLYPAGSPVSHTVQIPEYKDYDQNYGIRVSYNVTYECYYFLQGWKTINSSAENIQLIKPGDVGSTNGSYRTGELKDGTSGTTRNIQITKITSCQVYKDNKWQDSGDADNLLIEDGNRIVLGNEISSEGEIVEKTNNYNYQYRSPHATGKTVNKTVNDALRYYGPATGTTVFGDFLTKPADVSSPTLGTRSFVGTAFPMQGNDYYETSGKEVDVTMGYLSHPYAISVLNPEIPVIEGVTGSDYFFYKYGSNIKSSKFDHSFFSGGLRDNVTMLDVKSYYDVIEGNNISLAVGYSLSYILNDYSWMIRLGHVMNNGMVYIRATGDTNSSDSDLKTDETGDLHSGKGWSLQRETNVFHQFYGIDQYQNSSGTSTALGWDTQYHRAYFNLAGDPGGAFQWLTGDTKAPQADYSPNIDRYGSTDYGTNCHPMAQTECTCVNWGSTWDEKPQAMWGTANGTLLSWFYDYENKKASKITSVTKEFESYHWAEAYGSVVTNHYGYMADSTKYSNYGFISVLESINDVAYGDGVWVAVGNQSKKAPIDYCAGGSCYSNSTNIDDGLSTVSPGAGQAASYVNVKFTNDAGVTQWKAIRISDNKNVNILSVVYCQSVWYIMGYVDGSGVTDANGKKDADETCVLYYSVDPASSGGWHRCMTGKYNSVTKKYDYDYANGTTAVRFNGTNIINLNLEGINKMASQG